MPYSHLTQTGFFQFLRSFPVLSLFLLTLPLASCRDGTTQASAPPAVPVKLQVVQPATVIESSQFIGTLESAAKVNLTPETQGRIVNVLVQPGDRVDPGTPILTIQPGQTVPQLQGAQAGVSAAQANQQAMVDQFRVAEKNLEVAQTELASAQSSRDLSKTNYERASFLLSQGAIGTYNYDRAKTDLDIAGDRVDAAQKRVSAAQASVSQARAVVNQANAGIRQAQSQVSAAAVNVGFKEVVAPIGGTVGELFFKVGDVVSGGQSITNIVQNNALDLRLSVPSNRLNQLRRGLTVELIDPVTRDRIGTGAINFISPTVDSAAQVVLVKARFPNPDGRLRNGQSVEARIIWDRDTGILIPTNAVLQVSGKSFAYVAETDNSQGEARQVARMRPVTLGEIQAQDYQVIDGLNPGENLIVSGILRLRDGVPIQPES
ncbi:efflux RND transporter periplasmic adaptor subunit [Leptolyngbya ohadii]|uniref:efflux RND transporter periplasmic adaptor subunit n=1 Tax=Leptolyngbya ohadii TaxID=1962290 RepID=UPI000B59CACC|nr:efflux RND transporter periplasmic adaptor subunit [Leptolyngbya ohadii]